MKNTLKVVTILVAGLVRCGGGGRLALALRTAQRSHTSDQKGLLRTWPTEGPKVLWTTPVGAGFGGPAVKDGQVYPLDRDEAVGDTLRVLDLASGKELWTFAYAAAGKFMFAGSRTTPTVDGDHVYTNGPLGDLYSISMKTRKPVGREEHLEGLRRR